MFWVCKPFISSNADLAVICFPPPKQFAPVLFQITIIAYLQQLERNTASTTKADSPDYVLLIPTLYPLIWDEPAKLLELNGKCLLRFLLELTTLCVFLP